jgi:hypothetical protein
VTFKQRAGVLEVFLGVDFGGGDAFKRFVEDADDAPLFGDGRIAYIKRLDFWEVDRLMNRPTREAEDIFALGEE